MPSIHSGARSRFVHSPKTWSRGAWISTTKVYLPNSLPPGTGSRGDALQGALPTGVDGNPGLIEVDEHRRVIGRYGNALARLAVDLRSDDALGDGRRHEQVVDAHAHVLVEVALAVIPPREPAGL